MHKVISIMLLIISAPIFVIVALMIFISLGRPVFFKQDRVGLCGCIFEIYKFRTMTGSDKDISSNSNYLERTTWITRKIRAWKLDELPQVINIYRKQLAFFGPRPLKAVSKIGSKIVLHGSAGLPPRYLELRQSVMPGVIGLAQVLGIDHNQARRRYALDIFFVRNDCFWLRFKILLMLFRRLFNKIDEKIVITEDKK